MSANQADQPRLIRIQELLEDLARRRDAGEALDEQRIIAAHPELMPELAQQLRDLRVIDEARRRAHDEPSPLRDWRQATTAGSDAGGRAGAPACPLIPGFRIEREIHRGGQGVVYLAEQLATKRRVAVKVIRDGVFADEQDRLRFEREVEVLAQLQHPNVVTIHDSGVAGGVQYFVMDYVEGVTLDAHVAAARPSVKELLALFAKVCDAVEAAHVKGVVHRDLKPSNVRVGVDGEPRVLDFGLAKLTVADAAEKGLTTTGKFYGSLPWASPEQAEAVPGKIDVRSDVYSLGVILYQMLTGGFPYAVTGPPRDVLDNIQTAAPRRPRRATTGAASFGPATTRTRSTLSLSGFNSWLRRSTVGAINHEVETIVLKCLEKERERRYGSAGQLARDLRRYLAGEPIQAKRASPWYVLRKRIQRRRGGVAAAAAVLVAVAASWSWRSASLREAVAQVAYADALHAFSDGAYETARARAADASRAPRTALAARLLEASALLELGEHELAAERLQALADKSAAPGPVYYLLAQSGLRAGDERRFERYTRLYQQNEPRTAQALYLQALACFRDTNESLGLINRALDAAPDFFDAVRLRVALRYVHGDFRQMIQDARLAVALRPQDSGAHYDLANALHRHGMAEAADAPPPALLEAETEYRRAIALRPEFARAWENLGLLLLNGLARPDEALRAFQEALRLQPDDKQTLGDMAVALEELGREDEALRIYERLIAAWPDDVACARLHAEALYQLGRHADALREFEAIAARWPDDTRSQSGLAWLYLLRGGPGDDEKALEVAHALRRADPQDADSLNIYAFALACNRRATEARQAALRGIDLKGENVFDVGVLAVCDWQGGDVAAAREQLARAETLAEELPATIVGAFLERVRKLLDRASETGP